MRIMPGLFVAALAAIVAAILPVAFAFDCRNEIVTRIGSPDGVSEAVLFQRDCGATTGFSTQISVLPPRVPAGGWRQCLSRRREPRPNMRLGAWHGPWAAISWLSPRHLLIRYVAGARLFVRETEIYGIAISYEPVASPARP